MDKEGTSVGVGDWSSFKGLFNGSTDGRIVFGVGSYVVDLTFGTTSNHPVALSKPLISVAKRMAAKLR